MIYESAATMNDRTYLRQRSLKAVLICTVVWLYAWCAALFHTGDRFRSDWIGPVLVIGGLGISFAILKHNTSLSAAVLIAGFAAAVLHRMWLAGLGVAPYMLAVVVSLVGVLFNLETVFWAIQDTLCS